MARSLDFDLLQNTTAPFVPLNCITPRPNKNQNTPVKRPCNWPLETIQFFFLESQGGGKYAHPKWARSLDFDLLQNTTTPFVPLNSITPRPNKNKIHLWRDRVTAHWKTSNLCFKSYHEGSKMPTLRRQRALILTFLEVLLPFSSFLTP